MAVTMDGTIARPRPILALGLRLLTAFVLATMGMLVKLAGDRGVHLGELIFWRQAVTFPLIAGMLFAMGQLHTVRTRRMSAHIRRAAYGLTGMGFVYGAVLLLPLAEATTISFTAPMFAVLLSMVLFKTRIGAYRWTAIGLGFAGVTLVMIPELGAGGSNDGEDGILPLGVFVGLIAAFLVALISIQIQDLNTTETPYAIVFWFTGLTAPVAALAMPFVARAHDGETWAIIAAMALCGAAAQIALTASLRYGSAATIIIMDYTALIWATFYGWSVFDRIPPITLWLGAPLIVASGLLVTWREHRLRTSKPA